ncbi:MAG TPA: P83/100 family protein [Rectinemataceae bacterium]|nr:P83/100 family protein [Rectinemataceae bacterium]
MNFSNRRTYRDRGPRAAATILLAILPLLGLSALDVAKSEIESTREAKISFVNYEGPQSIVQSAAEIRGIGLGLATAIGAPGQAIARAGDLDRYAVIRAVDPSIEAGLDADIIVIGKDAVVDHIDNVRRIVAGYLEKAWGYSRADAATLSVFITVYNAVHRGDMAYLSAKYKAVVLAQLSPDNAGLATKWDEWPGKTRILIPLSSGAKPGAAGAVSTGTISGQEVTQGMKTEQGGGIPDRQALVDIKQKEVAQSQDQAAKAKEEAAAAAAQAEAAKAQLAQAQKDLAAAQAAAPAAQAAAPGPAAPSATPQAPAAQTAQAGAAATTAAPPAAAPTVPAPATPAATPQGQAQQASVTTPAVAAAEQNVANAQKALDTAQATEAAKTAEAQKADAAAASKQAEIAADRKSIATDQNAAIAGQVAVANAAESAGILLFEIVDAGYPFARLDFVDTTTGALIRASTLNSIRSRSIVDDGSLIVAVAGKEGGTGAVRLVALDRKSLAKVAESSVDIHPESLVAKIDGAYYAVIKAGDGKYYLGRFGSDLKETARSKDAVNPLTFMVKGADGIVAQAAGGGFLSLDAASLATIRHFGPY